MILSDPHVQHDKVFKLHVYCYQIRLNRLSFMKCASFISLGYSLFPSNVPDVVFRYILGCIHKATVLHCLRLIDSCFACNTAIHLSGPEESTSTKRMFLLSRPRGFKEWLESSLFSNK